MTKKIQKQDFCLLATPFQNQMPYNHNILLQKWRKMNKWKWKLYMLFAAPRSFYRKNSSNQIRSVRSDVWFFELEQLESMCHITHMCDLHYAQFTYSSFDYVITPFVEQNERSTPHFPILYIFYLARCLCVLSLTIL